MPVFVPVFDPHRYPLSPGTWRPILRWFCWRSSATIIARHASFDAALPADDGADGARVVVGGREILLLASMASRPTIGRPRIELTMPRDRIVSLIRSIPASSMRMLVAVLSLIAIMR